jgi:transposase
LDLARPHSGGKLGRQDTDQIAAELHCHPQTVRIHVARFNQQGIEGLGVQPGSGLKPRLTESERSVIVALPSQPPPGRLVTQRDGTIVARDESGSAQWSLDALALAAKEAGIRVKRSQIRRILLKERVRWRQTHSWGTPRDKDFVPIERWSLSTTQSHRRARLPSVPMNSDQ